MRCGAALRWRCCWRTNVAVGELDRARRDWLTAAPEGGRRIRCVATWGQLLSLLLRRLRQMVCWSDRRHTRKEGSVVERSCSVTRNSLARSVYYDHSRSASGVWTADRTVHEWISGGLRVAVNDTCARTAVTGHGRYDLFSSDLQLASSAPVTAGGYDDVADVGGQRSAQLSKTTRTAALKQPPSNGPMAAV